MAPTIKVCASVVDAAFHKKVDIEKDVLKFLLVGAIATPDPVKHLTVEDVGDEVNGEGYTEGGVALKNVKFTLNDKTATFGLTADPIEMKGLTTKTRYGLVNDETADVLVAIVDFDAETEVTAGDLKVTLDKAGIVSIKVN